MDFTEQDWNDVFEDNKQQKPVKSVEKPVQTEEKGILGTIADIGKGIISGPFKEAENTVQSVHDVADLADNALAGGRFINDDTDVDYVPDAIKPETGIGRTAQSLSAFATGWITFGRWIKTGAMGIKGMAKLAEMSPKIANLVTSSVAGGAVDFVTGDTTDSRLADVMVDNEVFGHDLVSFLASKPDDSAAEARFKNTLEGLMLGATTEGVLQVFNVFKGVKAARSQLGKGTEEVMKARQDATAVVEKYFDMNGTSAAADGLTLTTEGQRLMRRKLTAQSREKIFKESNNAILGAGEGQGMNAEKFLDPTRSWIKNNANKPITEAMQDRHMYMSPMGGKGFQNAIRADLDKAFNKENIAKLHGSLMGKSKQEEMATWEIVMDSFFGKHLDIAMQNMKEGLPNAGLDIDELLKRGEESLLHLRKLEHEAGQVLKAADVKALKAHPDKLLASMTDSQMFDVAHREIAALSLGEKLDLAHAVQVAYKNGTEIKEVLMSALSDKELRAAVSKNGRNPLWDKVIKYRYHAMLSGVKTLSRNALTGVGKTIQLAVEEPVNLMARRVMEGYHGGGLSGVGIGFKQGMKESKFYYQGLAHSLSMARDHAKTAFEYGKVLSHISEVNEAAKGITGKATVAKSLYEYPMRVMAATDEFFATLNAGAKTYEKAAIGLNKSGLLKAVTDPKEAQALTEKYIEEVFNNSFADAMLPDGTVIKNAHFITEEAKKAANEATMQQELGKWAGGFCFWVNQNPAMKLLFPFVKTPANLIKDAVWTRGAGALPETFKALRSGNPEAVGNAAAHLFSAAALWGSACWAIDKGLITGSGQKNVVERNALYENGWQPESIKVGDSYVKLSTVEPFGTPMVLLANIYETMQRMGEDDGGALAEASLNTILKFATSRTYMQSLSQLIDCANHDTVSTQFIPQFAASFVPNAFHEISQSMDDTIYQTNGMLETLQERIGIMSELEPKRSWLTGQPLVYNNGGGLGAFAPFQKTRDRGSMVLDELSKVTGIGDPSKQIGGYQLSPYEYAEYCKDHGTLQIDGKNLWQTLEEVIYSEQYDRFRTQWSDPTEKQLDSRRNDALVKVINAFRDEAKRRFIEKKQTTGSASGNNLDAIANF